jgi:hypothetical protein
MKMASISGNPLDCDKMEWLANDTQIKMSTGTDTAPKWVLVCVYRKNVIWFCKNFFSFFFVGVKITVNFLLLSACKLSKFFALFFGV